LILGLGASVLLTRVLQAHLFHVEPIDPPTIAAVAVFMAAVSVLACLVPARRATRVDPMIVMRQE
jgi:ABC-type lipoprotein release transport system permease subunit